MITAEEFFRKKIKEQTPFREVITLSQELITAEQGMRWGYEYAKLYAKEECIHSFIKERTLIQEYFHL